ncbi:MAG: serine hydrolase [Candidatus Aminicenantes bacterium]|nr:serine hydrolase [Candidatus Aminicenantes bacterium]
MGKNMVHIRILLFLVFIALCCHAISDDANNMGEHIQALMGYLADNDMFNGAVLVANKGEILYQKAFGFANLENKEKLKLHSVFCIGSVAKQFTAMAIMILKERKQLAYEDKLAQFFPQIENSEMITLRQLLTHTSGLKRGIDFPELKVNGGWRDGITNQDVFDGMTKHKVFDFMPGEKYSYSNYGYILLAMVVEKVSGLSFPEFMKRFVFDPLKMKNSFAIDKNASQATPRAIGYDIFNEKNDFNIFTNGPGGIFSTVEDLFRWDQGLYTEKLVSQETLNDAFASGLLNNGKPSRTLSDSTWGYGFGWLLRKNDSENIVWHDGGFNGFSAVFYRELNKKICIVILCNKGQMGANAPVYAVHEALLKILKGESCELPKIPILIKMHDMIEKKGLKKSLATYHALKNKKANNYDFSVNQLNNLGYFYLGKKNFVDAIAIFKLNTEIYPANANTFDSLGEAYMKNGQDDLAIINYEKSLVLNPKNKNAEDMLKKLHGLSANE